MATNVLAIRKIGYECKFDGNRWVGPVFASQDAVVCVLLQRYNRTDMLAAGIGQLAATGEPVIWRGIALSPDTP